mmetsp:Transcript_44904/g.88339  ORF Transcript_44904/g.88339 Transcript_44904/m.88339 type:complete len:573 (-) Transcript_44904:190-1908(-)
MVLSVLFLITLVAPSRAYVALKGINSTPSIPGHLNRPPRLNMPGRQALSRRKGLALLAAPGSGGSADSALTGRKGGALLDEQSPPLRGSEARSVLALLLAAFLNLLGFTMAGPITPALGTHFGLKMGASFGALTSAYPLGMLCGLLFWSRLSDSVGRKPVMVASLMGSSCGLLLQALAVQQMWSVRTFLALRVLTGAFAGASPVSKAYLADIGAKAGRLPTYMAWRDAAATLAFIVGPALGGVLFSLSKGHSRRVAVKVATSSLVSRGAVAKAAVKSAETASPLALVIGCAAAGSALAALCVALFVARLPPSSPSPSPPPPPPPSPSSSTEVAAAPATVPAAGGVASQQDGGGDTSRKEEKEVEEVVACPLGSALWSGVASVCVVSMLFNLGASTFDAFFAQLAATQLGLSAASIGLVYTCMASLSFAVSTLFSARTQRRFGAAATCSLGLACVGSGLIGVGTALASGHRKSLFWAALALYQIGVPLYGPTVPTMLLRCVPAHQRGTVMGLDGAVNTLARVIAPLFFGRLFAARGATAAFQSAGSVVLAASVIAATRRLLVMRHQAPRLTPI